MKYVMKPINLIFYRRLTRIFGWNIILCHFSLNATAMTEADVILAALNSDKNIITAKIALTEDSLDLRDARSAWYPTASILINPTYTPLDTSAYFYEDSLGNKQSIGASRPNFSANNSLKIAQTIPGGGVVSAGLSQTSRTKLSKDSSGQTNYLNTFDIGFSQPLLKNAWGQSTIQRNMIVARLQSQINVLSQKKKIIDELSDIRIKYWKWYEAWALLDINIKNSNFAQDRLVSERTRFAIGRATNLDTLSALFEYLNASQNNMNAVLQEKNARNALKLALSVDSISLSADSPIVIGNLPPVDTFIAMVQNGDPQVDVYALLVKNIRLKIAEDKNNLLPDLSVSARYSHTTSSSKLFSSETSLMDNAVVSLILGYSFPTTNSVTKLARSRLSLTQNQLDKEAYQRALVQNISDMMDNWNMENEKMAIMDLATTIAQKQLDAAVKGYEMGTVDRLTLTDANNKFQRQSMNALSQKIAMKRLEIEFDRMTGVVLNRFGVSVQ